MDFFLIKRIVVFLSSNITMPRLFFQADTACGDNCHFYKNAVGAAVSLLM
jgi:hypothetical protein